MKKSLFSAALLTAACAVAFVSCKKDDDKKTLSRPELLVGTWNVNAVGIDDNNNGLLETAEYDSIPAGVALIQTYRADGSGVFTTRQPGQADQSNNIKWQLTSNDQNLQITQDGKVTNATISELTERQLQGYDPASMPRFVFLLTK